MANGGDVRNHSLSKVMMGCKPSFGSIGGPAQAMDRGFEEINEMSTPIGIARNAGATVL